MQTLYCFAIGLLFILPIIAAWHSLARATHRIIWGTWNYADGEDIIGSHCAVILFLGIAFGGITGIFYAGCALRNHLHL